MSYLNISFVASVTQCQDLFNLGLTGETLFHYRYDISDANDLHLVSRHMDHLALYSDIAADLPTNVSSNYRYLPAYMLSSMIESIPDISLKETSSEILLLSTKLWPSKAFRGKKLADVLVDCVKDILVRGLIPLNEMNSFFHHTPQNLPEHE